MEKRSDTSTAGHTQKKPEKLPLSGLKLIVTAYDLEQSEHRGIAVYSKSLIKALKQLGATIWLLSEFRADSNDRGAAKLPPATQKLIQATNVLEALATGNQPRKLKPFAEQALNKLKVYYLWIAWQNIKRNFNRRSKYFACNLIKIDISELFDNPYLRIERLDYLQWIDGILAADGIFHSTQVLAAGKKLNPQTLKIDISGFDGLITTCPLYIKPIRSLVFVQTIHDIIPLEYSQTSDSMLGFSRRLQASQRAKKIFISESTAIKYKKFVTNSDPDLGGKILIQPASLNFDDSFATNFTEYVEIQTANGSYKKLRTRRFLLFNSSIEPRKNVHFLLNAFKVSGLGVRGWKLCITGKPKDDNYSREVIKLSNADPAVILTGYVDELTKHKLFLATECLLSPSLVEGFGIPVLDAACLGVTTIASPSESHAEIKNLYDFHPLVRLKDTLNVKTWAAAMNNLADERFLDNTPVNKTIERRLARYNQMQNRIFETFKQQLGELIIAKPPVTCRSIKKPESNSGS